MCGTSEQSHQQRRDSMSHRRIPQGNLSNSAAYLVPVLPAALGVHVRSIGASRLEGGTMQQRTTK